MHSERAMRERDAEARRFADASFAGSRDHAAARARELERRVEPRA